MHADAFIPSFILAMNAPRCRFASACMLRFFLRMHHVASKLGVRWTIGDVSDAGFEALRLSIHGAFRLFGPRARYAVCVNTVPLNVARTRTGEVPSAIEWHDVSNALDSRVRAHFDENMAEGVGWKFAPMRVFEDRYELALDNDCILWGVPAAIRRWLEGEPGSCVIAEDVRRCFGQFADLCGPEPRNSGIRGIPSDFDLGAEIERLLTSRGAILRSELDEQGLQVAAVSNARKTHVVRVEEVTICSPFPPHLPELGRLGAHFCGLNAKALPWSYEGRPASELTREHFARHRPALYARVGLSMAA